jgi:hypothetical protein
MNTLQGHGESGMAARYGKGFLLRKLDKWMRKVHYPDLDLSHLQRRGANACYQRAGLGRDQPFCSPPCSFLIVPIANCLIEAVFGFLLPSLILRSTLSEFITKLV